MFTNSGSRFGSHVHLEPESWNLEPESWNLEPETRRLASVSVGKVTTPYPPGVPRHTVEHQGLYFNISNIFKQ